ncbi:MAG: zinc ribbon domain-containing protein [Minisyncoccia bacterium]
MDTKKCVTNCESCLMPLSKDTGVRESDTYCSYCFTDGKLCYEGEDVKEFQKICYESMRAHGMNVILASFYTWCIRFAPRWKGKKA